MSVSAKLYCKKSERKSDGTAPVYIVLRINNKDKLIATGKYVNPDNFDNSSGKLSRAEANSMKLNAYLGAKLALIEKIILDLQHEGRAITHEQVIQSYDSDGKLLFVDFCRQELEESGIIVLQNPNSTLPWVIQRNLPVAALKQPITIFCS
jgi:integrase/recombinase XerD